MSIFSCEAARKRVKHAEMRMKWRVNCNCNHLFRISHGQPLAAAFFGDIMPLTEMKVRPSARKEGSLSFRRRRRKIEKGKISRALLLIAELALVAVLAFAVSWSFFYRVRMSGQSMEAGISNGDRLLLNRVVYHLKNPGRGDVIAFYPSGNPNANPTVKRIMGIPGDRLNIEDGYLYINGKEYAGRPEIGKIKDAGLLATEVVLGKDEYFVLGDNTGASEDSRFSTIGNISRKDIIGIVWWNMSFNHLGVPG